MSDHPFIAHYAGAMMRRLPIWWTDLAWMESSWKSPSHSFRLDKRVLPHREERNFTLSKCLGFCGGYRVACLVLVTLLTMVLNGDISVCTAFQYFYAWLIDVRCDAYECQRVYDVIWQPTKTNTTPFSSNTPDVVGVSLWSCVIALNANLLKIYCYR